MCAVAGANRKRVYSWSAVRNLGKKLGYRGSWNLPARQCTGSRIRLTNTTSLRSSDQYTLEDDTSCSFKDIDLSTSPKYTKRLLRQNCLLITFGSVIKSAVDSPPSLENELSGFRNLLTQYLRLHRFNRQVTAEAHSMMLKPPQRPIKRLLVANRLDYRAHAELNANVTKRRDRNKNLVFRSGARY